MGMSDRETVALIGGGHSFGKVHGACPTGAGPGPLEDYVKPWPGTCGSGPSKGKGNNTFTSGFEGAWTAAPTTWTNEYFKNLLEYNWKLITGPGNNPQWFPVSAKDGSKPDDVIMLTSDIALLYDPSYRSIVREFAADLGALTGAFARAWYKLTTADMGPATRCLGPDVPPPMFFQNPLPEANKKVDFAAVTKDVMEVVRLSNKKGREEYVRLAWQCASTY